MTETPTRRISPWLLALLLLLLLPLAALGTQEISFDTQTIMVYIVGSDLESNHGLATKDMVEMIRARPDGERIKLLVMTGGTTRWHDAIFSNKELGIYRIEGSRPVLEQAWPGASMGQAETLSQFLDYAVTAHPADSYGLILWDHGAGPLLGFGADTAFAGDGLTMLELKQALGSSPFGQGQRLEWLAFDACLMATAEIAGMMQPHSRYMIASQETLPGHGFDYGFIRDIKQTGLSGPEVARAIIDKSWDYYEALTARSPHLRSPVTLSLLDLDLTSQLQAALDQLFTSLDKGLTLGIYSDIARNRDRTKDYGRSTTTNAYDLIDLYHLSDNLSALYPEQAAQLQQAIAQMVLHNRANAPHSSGLSIYFPLRNKRAYAEGWGQLYGQLGLSSGYGGFLNSFGQILLSDSLSNWTGEDAPPVMYDETTGEYFIQLSPEQVKNYESAQYYVLARLRGEEYQMKYMSSDVTLDSSDRLYANFSGKALYIDDPLSDESIIPFLRETEREGALATYQIPSVFARGNPDGSQESLPGELLVQIDTQKGQASILGAIRSDEQVGMMGKRDLDIYAWDQVMMLYLSAYLTRDQQGALLPYGDWAPSDAFRLSAFDLASQMRLRYDWLAPDQYEYMVLISITDTQGHVYTSELMPLSGNNLPAASPAPKPQPTATPRFDQEAEQPLTLLRQEGLTIQLQAMGLDAQDSQRLQLHLKIDNSLNQPRQLSAGWAAVNGQVLPAQLMGDIAPMDSTDLAMSIQLPEGFEGPVTRLDLRMTIASSRQGLFNSLSTPLISILSDLALPPPQTPAAALPEGRLLAEHEGLRIYLAGEPDLKDDQLVVPLRVVNDSQRFDMLQLQESVINGVMATMSLGLEDVPPGSELYTQASIPLLRTLLPADMAQYQYLFDGPDSLEALGIAQPETLSLHFALDARDHLDQPDKPYLRVLTEPVRLSLPGFEGQGEAPDEQGELIYEHEGLRLIRLDSDPSGERFAIVNRGDHGLYLHSWGFTKVDGVDYGANTPLQAYVAADAVAYRRLFDLLPGVRPEASELSFRLTLIDPVANRLIHRSQEPITLSLRPSSIDETP